MKAKNEPRGWDWVSMQVDGAKAEGRYKTAANYLTAARSWSKYVASSEWRFSEMDASKVEGYQRWLAQRGICQNTISAYMRALRAMCCRLTGDRLPFDRVFTGRAKTAKRSITEQEIQRLKALPLPEGSSLCLARDLFIFSFHAMGMPFVDIAYLKKSQIRQGFIKYARHKTGQPIRVAVLPQMRSIMERYDTPDSEYVFPILSASTPDGLHKQYACCLRRYNYSLHRLSKLAGFSRPLSSYVVRHSWASIAYQHHVDIGLIGKALGHTKTSTTLLYIKELFDVDLAEANQALMSKIGFS